MTNKLMEKELLKKQIEMKQSELTARLRTLRAIKYGAPAAGLGVVAGGPINKAIDKQIDKIDPGKKIKEETSMSSEINLAQIIYEDDNLTTREKIDMIKEVKNMSEGLKDTVIKYGRKLVNADNIKAAGEKVSRQRDLGTSADNLYLKDLIKRRRLAIAKGIAQTGGVAAIGAGGGIYGAKYAKKKYPKKENN